MNNLSLYMISLVAFGGVGCGHMSMPQQNGTDTSDVSVSTDARVGVPESDDESTFVADMECPPMETGASNIRGTSSCAHAAMRPIAVSARDGTANIGNHQPPLGDKMNEIPDPPVAPTATDRMSPSTSHMHDNQMEDDDEGSQMSEAPSEQTPSKSQIDRVRRRSAPSLAPKKGESQRPSKMTTCSPQWVVWNELHYNCCETNAEYPEVVYKMCRHSDDDRDD